MKLRSRKELSHRGGVVLLEVVLALALFVGAAAVLSSTMSASLASVERQKLGLHAENLASSLLAEIQMGARPATAGEFALEPSLTGWRAELLVESAEQQLGDTNSLSLLEVVIRSTNSPLVRRMAQTMETAATTGSEAIGEALAP